MASVAEPERDASKHHRESEQDGGHAPAQAEGGVKELLAGNHVPTNLQVH